MQEVGNKHVSPTSCLQTYIDAGMAPKYDIYLYFKFPNTDISLNACLKKSYGLISIHVYCVRIYWYQYSGNIMLKFAEINNIMCTVAEAISYASLRDFFERLKNPSEFFPLRKLYGIMSSFCKNHFFCKKRFWFFY